MNLNQRVIVQSELAPVYNGLVGRVIRSVTDPNTNQTQYRVRADNSEENREILSWIGMPYVNLDKEWEFWFVESELQIA
jgi:hypothetical protein